MKMQNTKKGLLISVIVLTLNSQSASASDAIASQSLQKSSAPAKQPFSIRHPKIYGAVHRTKLVCEEIGPILQAGGSVAQCLLFFRGY